MSAHVTQKSHKTQARDKPKHSRISAGSLNMQPRKQGGGRGNWGRPGDEYSMAAEEAGLDGPCDPRDPAYDPDYAERVGAHIPVRRDSTSSTSPSNGAQQAAARRKSVNAEEVVDPLHAYDPDDERHPCHRQIV